MTHIIWTASPPIVPLVLAALEVDPGLSHTEALTHAIPSTWMLFLALHLVDSCSSFKS